MRSLLSFLCVSFALVLFSEAGASDLPPCPQVYNESTWHNCFGVYTTDKGHKYIGDFQDGDFNGQGIYTFVSGSSYVGEFKDDNFNGQGAFTSTNGNKYVGEFKDDKKHGQGMYTWANGRVKKGVWQDDKLVYSGTRKGYDRRLKRRRKVELANAIERCLYEDLDRISSNSAERTVRRNCQQQLEKLSTKELENAYD